MTERFVARVEKIDTTPRYVVLEWLAPDGAIENSCRVSVYVLHEKAAIVAFLVSWIRAGFEQLYASLPPALRPHVPIKAEEIQRLAIDAFDAIAAAWRKADDEGRPKWTPLSPKAFATMLDECHGEPVEEVAQ